MIFVNNLFLEERGHLISMKENKIQKSILDFTFVFIGCLLLSFAITSILKPNGLMTGGITGISILLEKLIRINYSYIYYFLSVMVLLSAWLFLGRKDAYRILLLTVAFPTMLVLMEKFPFPLVENDTFLATVYYGIIAGVGCGLIMKRGFSAGGTDTIAKIIQKKLLPFVNIGQILLCIDTLIVLMSGFLFNRNVALYAIITQIIFMKSMETVLFGLGSKSVKIEIISCGYEEISEYILNQISRGISIYDITGGYTNQTKRKIVCICSPREAMLIRMFVSQVDQNAFVDILPVISVWGNGIGFQSIVESENA